MMPYQCLSLVRFIRINLAQVEVSNLIICQYQSRIIGVEEESESVQSSK